MFNKNLYKLFNPFYRTFENTHQISFNYIFQLTLVQVEKTKLHALTISFTTCKYRILFRA